MLGIRFALSLQIFLFFCFLLRVIVQSQFFHGEPTSNQWFPFLSRMMLCSSNILSQIFVGILFVYFFIVVFLLWIYWAPSLRCLEMISISIEVMLIILAFCYTFCLQSS